MIYRQSNVFQVASDQDLQPGAAYTVTAYKPGATCSGIVTVSGQYTTIPVHPGHGFSGGETLMAAFNITTFTVVEGVDETHIYVPRSSELVNLVSTGDVLLNLGNDHGTFQPNYDGSPLVIYPLDDNTSLPIVEARLTTSEEGLYTYWHDSATPIWEVIRDTAGNPVAYTINSAQGGSSLFGVNVRDYGAIGDGVTDDTAAFQAALAALPPTAGLYSAGKLLVPKGIYRLSATLNLSQGHFIEGEGPSGSCLLIDSAFSGTALLKWELSLGNDQGVGYGIRDIAIDGNGVSVHAIHMVRAYDAILIDNVRVDDIGPLGNCYRIEGDEANGANINRVAQSILLSNTYGIHARDSNPTAATYFFKTCQEMTLSNAKGFGSYSTSVASGDVFYFQGCRGVTIVGGAAANSTGVGYHIVSSDRTSEGFQFLGPTLEAVGTSIKVESTAGLATRAVYIYGPRLQQGTVTPATSTGPIVLNSTLRAWVNAATFEVQIGANSQDCYIHTDNLALVTADAGSRTRIQAGYDLDDATSSFFHAFGQSINMRDNSSGGPRLRFSHRSRSPQDFWDLLWSANSSADFGFQLRYFDGTTAKNVITSDAAAGDLHLCSGGVEMLEVEANGIHSKGQIRGIAASVSVTGNDEVTTVGRFLINLTNVSGTNTITLTAPSSQDGQILILRISAITTGSISLANTAATNLEGDWTTPGVGDTLTLVASASTWYELSRSNN